MYVFEIDNQSSLKEVVLKNLKIIGIRCRLPKKTKVCKQTARIHVCLLLSIVFFSFNRKMRKKKKIYTQIIKRFRNLFIY